MEVAEYHSKLTQLMQQLQAKQAAMQSMSEHAALKQRYDERLLELRQHLQELEQERLELLRKLESLQHASGGGPGTSSPGSAAPQVSAPGLPVLARCSHA